VSDGKGKQVSVLFTAFEPSGDAHAVAHVAVDSPAANFPITKATKKTGARIVHLVAPQVWAWGRWRVPKLRRLTDLVLCLLPFEEQWFNDRGITARFIGHPRMNRPLDTDDLRKHMHGLPQGTPRIGIFPGSRTQEVKRNIKLLVDTYTELQARHAGMCGVIVAANKELALIIRKKIPVFPTGLHMITGQLDATICWSDLCIAVSGTVSMDICRQQKPLIGVYKTSLIAWLGSKVILRTPYRLLPNIIAEREIVPEFVPHAGGSGPLVRAANEYLLDSKNQAITAEELARVCHRFVNKRPPEEAAKLIFRLMKDGAIT
jgi:lipid-A-disaccharide synthase